jgi:signal peptidase I
MAKQDPSFWYQWILSSLQEGKAVEIVAKGWSMWPTIKPGTSLTISKVDISALRPGDLIAFTRAEHFVVHRIEEIQFNGSYAIYTRGDANLRRDELITIDNYCGKVQVVLSNGNNKKEPEQIRNNFLRFRNALVQFTFINLNRAKKIPLLLKRDPH